jgi:hypothetical protein
MHREAGVIRETHEFKRWVEIIAIAERVRR